MFFSLEPGPSYLGSTESRQVLGHRHQDETESRRSNHKGESFGPAPDVKDLGHGDVDCRGHGVADDADDGKERMRLEVARHVRDQTEEDGLPEAVDEEQHPHAIEFIS